MLKNFTLGVAKEKGSALCVAKDGTYTCYYQLVLTVNFVRTELPL